MMAQGIKVMTGTFTQTDDTSLDWRDTLEIGFGFGLNSFFNIEWLIDSLACNVEDRSWD